jgi:hypothetical protein
MTTLTQLGKRVLELVNGTISPKTMHAISDVPISKKIIGKWLLPVLKEGSLENQNYCHWHQSNEEQRKEKQV